MLRASLRNFARLFLIALIRFSLLDGKVPYSNDSLFIDFCLMCQITIHIYPQASDGFDPNSMQSSVNNERQ